MAVSNPGDAPSPHRTTATSRHHSDTQGVAGGFAAPHAPPPHNMKMASAMSHGGGAPAPDAMPFPGGEGGGRSRGRVDGVAVAAEMAAAGDAVPGVDPTALRGPVMLRDASLSVTALDTRAAMSAVVGVVTAGGGHVESSSTSSDPWLLQRWEQVSPRPSVTPPPNGPTFGHLSLRVPSDKLDATLAAVRTQLEGTGAVVGSESVSTRDESANYVDAVNRARVDTVALAKTEALMAAATTVHEMLQVKREMDIITSRIESAKGTRAFLEGRAALAGLQVTVSLPEPPQRVPPPPPTHYWSPLATAGRALSALGGALSTVVDLLIYASVFFPIVALVVAGAAWAVGKGAPWVKAAIARAGWGAGGG